AFSTRAGISPPRGRVVAGGAQVQDQNRTAKPMPTTVPPVTSAGGSGRTRRQARLRRAKQATRPAQKTREKTVDPATMMTADEAAQYPPRMPTQSQAVRRRLRIRAAIPAAETANNTGATT